MKILSALTCSLALTAGTLAQAATVDFSNFSEGDVISGSTLDFGGGVTGTITVDSNNFVAGAANDQARIFSTAPGSLSAVNDPDLAGTLTNVNDPSDTQDFGNVLIIQEVGGAAGSNGAPDDEAGGGTITFMFDQAIDLLSISLLDGEEDITVTAGPRVFTNVGGADNEFETIMASVFGITQFEIDFGGSGALGEFDFQIAAVPLPATLPMFLVALAGAGLVLRRRHAG